MKSSSEASLNAKEGKKRRIEAPMNSQLARRKRGRENGALRRQSHLQWRRPEVYFEVSAENSEKGGIETEAADG